MPPAYELLLLNTSIPQIQAAQSGDTYLCPRELAVVVNSSTDALRITQTGAGNAILVEDSANPDSTPFVVTAAGDVGIGASSPGYALDVQKSVANGVVANFQSTSTSAVNTGVAFRSSASNAANRNWALLANSSAFGDFVIRTSTTNGGDPVSGTDRLMIDPSGNLGLGVTPQTDWYSSVKAFQIGAATSLWASTSNGNFGLTANEYLDSSAVSKRIVTDYATRYQQYSGQHVWYNAASAAAGSTISFTQAMTLDASGDLAIGTTTGSIFSTSGVNVSVSNTSGIATVAIAGSTGNSGYLELGQGSVRGALIEGSTNTMIFYTNGTGSGTSVAERARITSGGDLLVGTDDPSEISEPGARLTATGAVRSTRSGSTGTSSTLDVYSTGVSAFRFYVDMAGTVFATSTTISAISDQRFKENIRDLDVGLNAVLALKPRKFDWKAGKGKDKKDDRGFIAQEFEQVFPDLIDTWKDPAPEGEEPYKSVRQDLIPVLVKAIQEQQAMIDELKAEVAALKGA